MRNFRGDTPGQIAWIRCALITDLTDEDANPTQVDVRLENNKVLRVPYHWLWEEGPDVGIQGKAVEVPIIVDDLDEDVVIVKHNAPAKKVTIKRP